MGTRENPGEFDCAANALPDEPQFTLVARDPDFAVLIFEWATRRLQRIARGEKPITDVPRVIEALELADQGADWRAANHGKWRRASGEG